MPVTSSLRSKKAGLPKANERERAAEAAPGASLPRLDPLLSSSPTSSSTSPDLPPLSLAADSDLNEVGHSRHASASPSDSSLPSSSSVAGIRGLSQAVASSSEPSPLAGAPVARGVSLLRQAPRTRLRPSQIPGGIGSKPEGGGGSRLSLRPTAVASTASATRAAGLSTSTASPPSRPSSAASGSSNRPSSKQGKAVPPAAVSDKRAPSADLSASVDRPNQLPVALGHAPLPLVGGLLPSTAAPDGPSQPTKGSRLSARTSGVVSRPEGRDRTTRMPSGRVALAETTTANSISSDASYFRRLSSPKVSGSPSVATESATLNHKRTTSMLPAPTSLRPTPSAATARTHRRSLSTTQAPSPSLARPSAVPQPRPRPASVLFPRSTVGSLARTASPPVASATAACEPRPCVASAHATPTTIVVPKPSSASHSIATAATPDRSAVGLGL